MEDVTDEFLKQDWSQDTVDDDIILCDYWSTPDENSYTWKGEQVIILSSLVVLLSSPKLTQTRRGASPSLMGKGDTLDAPLSLRQNKMAPFTPVSSMTIVSTPPL